MIAWVLAFIAGVCVGLIIRINSFERHDTARLKHIRALERELHCTTAAFDKERARRYDAEIYLEDAQGIIKYQRDRLYEINHPTVLVEVRE